jgi:hypothetical protein
VIATLLIPAMMVMIIGGRFILGLFGVAYAVAGYSLLIVLAISAIPDAVSNVAVAVFRVTQRLGYSTVLNLGILVMTVAGAWVLMPRLGITGVGVAWLGAQTVGAIASLPAYVQLHKPMTLNALVAETQLHPGIAQLIDLARLQAPEQTQRPVHTEPSYGQFRSDDKGLSPMVVDGNRPTIPSRLTGKNS